MIIEAVEDHSKPHILVVDDDAFMRDMARESLTEAGFLVSEAENGVRALQALENLRPDIILLDVMMPEMDGFATASAVRQLPGCEMLPILIMTSLDDVDSINRAYEVGATDFITKPINWVILVQRVRYMTRAARMMNEQKQLEKELQQAQKLEAVATLAGGVAHDFNNLLQAIQASSELLLFKTHEGEPGFRILNQIIDAVDRGGGLIRQLLTYSRKIKSDKRPIDLNDQALQAHQLLQRTIPKMIEIDLRLEENLKLVDADPVQIEQVLMNLAINARDAMPDGGRLVIMTANHSRPEKQQWNPIRISFTGMGLAQRLGYRPRYGQRIPWSRSSSRSSAPRLREKERGLVCQWFTELSRTTTAGSHVAAPLAKGPVFESICRRSNPAWRKSRSKKRRKTRGQ